MIDRRRGRRRPREKYLDELPRLMVGDVTPATAIRLAENRTIWSFMVAESGMINYGNEVKIRYYTHILTNAPVSHVSMVLLWVFPISGVSPISQKLRATEENGLQI